MYSGRLKAEKEVKSRNKEAKEQTVIKEDGHRISKKTSYTSICIRKTKHRKLN